MTHAPRTVAATGPRFWLIALAALLGVLVTVSLGRWQLSRAAEKEALQAALDERGRLPAVDGAALLSAAAAPTGSAILWPFSNGS